MQWDVITYGGWITIVLLALASAVWAFHGRRLFNLLFAVAAVSMLVSVICSRFSMEPIRASRPAGCESEESAPFEPGQMIEIHFREPLYTIQQSLIVLSQACASCGAILAIIHRLRAWMVAVEADGEQTQGAAPPDSQR
jgi:hypothetical protein